MDYKQAFQDGLRAAEDAESARKEVDAVFAEVNRQLSEASGGKVRLYLGQLPEKPQPEALPIVRYNWESPKYSAIIAENPKAGNGEKRELARWNQSPNGYPCKLSSESAEISCEDKEGLENALTTLLGRAEVGEKLRALINAPEKKAA